MEKDKITVEISNRVIIIDEDQSKFKTNVLLKRILQYVVRQVRLEYNNKTYNCTNVLRNAH